MQLLITRLMKKIKRKPISIKLIKKDFDLKIQKKKRIICYMTLNLKTFN